MADTRTHYRIFVASPRDVAEERSIARDVIESLGKELGGAGQCTVEACGWEDVRAGLGRPQALINPLVQECDVLVGVLWKRFGTDTGVAESGTREEFDIMRGRFDAGEAVEIMMYFRDVPPEMLDDPGSQLSAVLKFRKEMDRFGLYHTFVTPPELREQLRRDLTQWLLARTGVAQPPGGSRTAGSTTREAPQRHLLDRFVKSQVAEHAYVPLAGFETRIRIPIELERVMVPLRARLAADGALHGRGKKGAVAAAAAEGIIDFEHAWRRARQRSIATLVVLGAPGSGKTTLLKHLLLRCARDPVELGLRPGTVPVLLPLRLVDPAESLERGIRRILRTDELQLPADLFDAALFGGTVLLLFDGLDEVSTGEAREKAARWIEAQRRRFPDCAAVVTARFAGYTGDARLEVPNLELSLERFREPEIRAFLERWFITVETTLGEETEFFQKSGRTMAENLYQRIATEPEIMALATNPLMLQIIALVHRDRGALPERRIELYDECTNVLLEHWDRAKKGLNVPLTAKEARRILQPVAYWMHQEPERRYAPRSELIPLIGRELAEFPKKQVQAEEFLDTIRDRSGLFTGHGVDEYGFQHLSFQEFLTAREIRRREAFDELVQVFGETWWREVTRLLMALEDPSCFEPFMRRLVGSAKFAQHPDLIAACIQDAFEPSVRPFVAALESGPGERDLVRLRYAALLALRQLPIEKVRPEGATLVRLHAEAADAEVRTLAAELLARLGVQHAADIDLQTGLPNLCINPIDGTELVLVAAGLFAAGDASESDNRPRQLELPSFYLARYPVTNTQYAKFLVATPGAEKPERWDDERFNQPQQPVVGVSWHDAMAYCMWAGLRLPTEWEWEKGARGADGRPYPWGKEDADETKANFSRKVGQPTPVGSYPAGASPYGLMDMAGNVWEWTASEYKRRKTRTVRGGAFGDPPQNLRAASRRSDPPESRYGVIGFRCAQDPVTP